MGFLLQKIAWKSTSFHGQQTSQRRIDHDIDLVKIDFTMDEDDIIFCTLVLHVVNAFSELQHSYHKLLLDDHILEQRRLLRSMPMDKLRPTWESFVDRTSPLHFKRMFRMSLSVTV